MLRITRVLLAIVAGIFILYVLYNLLPVLDQASSTQVYVEGNVKAGHLTPERGAEMLRKTDEQLYPYYLQLAGGVGFVIAAWLLLRTLERHMQTRTRQKE